MPRINIIICLLLIAGFALMQQLVHLPGDANEQMAFRKLLFILVMLLLARAARVRLRLFGYRPTLPGTTLLPALGLLILYLFARIDEEDLDAMTGMEGALPMVMVAMLAGTFAEELAFRLFIPANLSRLGYSAGQMCIASSLLFSLMHLLNLFKGEYDLFGVFNQLVFAFFMGILLFSIYYLTRSLLITWAYHFLVNLPGKLSALAQAEANVGVQAGGGGGDGDGLLASLVMLLFFSPLIIISLYYLRKIRKDDRVKHKGGNLAQSLFDTGRARAGSAGDGEG